MSVWTHKSCCLSWHLWGKSGQGTSVWTHKSCWTGAQDLKFMWDVTRLLPHPYEWVVATPTLSPLLSLFFCFVCLCLFWLVCYLPLWNEIWKVKPRAVLPPSNSLLWIVYSVTFSRSIKTGRQTKGSAFWKDTSGLSVEWPSFDAECLFAGTYNSHMAWTVWLAITGNPGHPDQFLT